MNMRLLSALLLIAGFVGKHDDCAGGKVTCGNGKICLYDTEFQETGYPSSGESNCIYDDPCQTSTYDADCQYKFTYPQKYAKCFPFRLTDSDKTLVYRCYHAYAGLNI